LIDCLVKFHFMYRTTSDMDIDPLKRNSLAAVKLILDKKKLSHILWVILKDTSGERATDYVKQSKFRDDFKAKSYGIDPNVARYVLRSFERHLNSGRESIDMNDVELEHIFPKNASAKWKNRANLETHVNRLGNLTLINKTVNQRISNKTFAEKKKVYEKSKLTINQKYLDYDSWSLTEMHRRERDFTDLAVKVWDLAEYSAMAKRSSKK